MNLDKKIKYHKNQIKKLEGIKNNRIQRELFFDKEKLLRLLNSVYNQFGSQDLKPNMWLGSYWFNSFSNIADEEDWRFIFQVTKTGKIIPEIQFRGNYTKE